MKPKEKAQELVEKFFKQADLIWYEGVTPKHEVDECAKQCALIAVDEIIVNAELYTEYDEESFKLTFQYEFWQQVKKEIEKL